MMSHSFAVTSPLPARGSADALREQLLQHLLRVRPRVGERFHSDYELSCISRLSRPTVRRAMHDLERGGWIERRPGVGTFIGPRAALEEREQSVDGHRRSSTVRVALLVHLNDLRHDWYTVGVMNAMERAADALDVSVELLCDRCDDLDAALRRLQQNRPDVLALASPSIPQIALVGAARVMNIRCIGTGTALAQFGVPAVSEDNVDAARRAVGHLADHGHRRIGLALDQLSAPSAHERRQGYLAGLAESAIEPDERLVLWLAGQDDESRSAAMEEYLERHQPTALLLGSSLLAHALGPLVRAGRVRIPGDLSVITFDQAPVVEMLLGGIRPTTMALPLAEMGRRLALLARDLSDGKAVDPLTLLPCELIGEESVAHREGSFS